MHPRILAILPHTVLLAVSAVLYYFAAQIESAVGSSSARIGPGSWPKFIVLSMAVLCLYEIVTRLLVGTTFTATGLLQGLNRPPEHAEHTSAPEPEPEYHAKLWGGIALIAAFVIAVPYVGFFVGTALFIGAFAWVGGFRRPVAACLIALIGALVLLLIFMRVAYISLPLGQGPFKDFSLLMLRLIGVS